MLRSWRFRQSLWNDAIPTSIDWIYAQETVNDWRWIDREIPLLLIKGKRERERHESFIEKYFFAAAHAHIMAWKKKRKREKHFSSYQPPKPSKKSRQSRLNKNSTRHNFCMQFSIWLDSLCGWDKAKGAFTRLSRSYIFIYIYWFAHRSFLSILCGVIVIAKNAFQVSHDLTSFSIVHVTYLRPISCSVELDCMLFVRSSSHHSGNADWNVGNPSKGGNKKKKINIYSSIWLLFY